MAPIKKKPKDRREIVIKEEIVFESDEFKVVIVNIMLGARRSLPPYNLSYTDKIETWICDKENENVILKKFSGERRDINADYRCRLNLLEGKKKFLLGEDNWGWNGEIRQSGCYNSEDKYLVGVDNFCRHPDGEKCQYYDGRQGICLNIDGKCHSK